MVNSRDVSLKLKKLNETQESIVETSKWIFDSCCDDPVTFEVILSNISSFINLSDPQYQVSNKKKLTYIYLLNDLSHLIKFKHADKTELVKSLDENIPQLVNDAMTVLPHDLQQKVVRVVSIWKQRNVYSAETLAKISLKLKTAPNSSSGASSTHEKASSQRIAPELKTINELYVKYHQQDDKSIELKKEIIRNLDMLITKEKRNYVEMKKKTPANKPLNNSDVPTLTKRAPTDEIPTYKTGHLPAFVPSNSGELPTYAASSDSDSDSDESKVSKSDASPFTYQEPPAVALDSYDSEKNMSAQAITEEYNPAENIGEPANKKLKSNTPPLPPVNKPSNTTSSALLTSNIQDLLNRLSSSKK